MKVRNLFILIIVVFVSACASIQTKINSLSAEDIVTYTSKTADGVSWIKGVTDFGMGIACSSGKVPNSVCTVYDQVSANAQVLINNAKQAVQNFESTGTIASQDQVKQALEDLLKINFKLDNVYKTNPESVTLDTLK